MSLKMPTAAQITEIVEPLLGRDGVAAVVGVALNGKTQLFFNSKGPLKAFDRTSLTLDGDTIFAIGSISKTFTATLYAWAGLPADTTLGDFRPKGGKPVGSNYADITLHSLATYSSGLPEDNKHSVLPPHQKKPYTVAEMNDYLATNPFPIHPKQGYAYSNLGFALLGEAVTIAKGSNGEDYESLLAAQITRHLGIDFTTLDVVSPALLPQAYYGNDPTSLADAIQYPAYNPAGGLVLSPNGFMKWMQFNMGLAKSRALNGLLAQTQTPSGVKTSKGIDVCEAWFYGPKPKRVYKDGGIIGFSSLVSFDASKRPGTDPSQAGVFIFVNQKQSLSSTMPAIFDIINNTTGSPAVETPELDAQ